MRLIAVAGAAILAATAFAEGPSLRLRVSNPLDSARASETVELRASALAPEVSPSELDRATVSDLRSGREVLSQAVDEDGDGLFDALVFQADFAAREVREFRLGLSARRKPRFADYKVYGRFVRERHDDFAWENDKVAFRLYGPALETFQREPLTSSTVDAWSKRTTRLVVNEWYLQDDYHEDHGEGGDFYAAGKSRGCGGSGLVVDGALVVSKNFRASRVLASGPIRLVFEVDYPEWERPDLGVTETKRVTLDAGSHLNRFESHYRTKLGGPLLWAVGIRLAEGVVPRLDRPRGTVRSWEHQTRYGENGWLGCGVILDPSSIVELREEAGNQIVVARTPSASPATWYAGSGWDRSGAFPDAASWDRYLDDFAVRLRAPLVTQVLR